MDYLDISLKIILGVLTLLGVKDIAYKITLKFKKHSNTLNLKNSTEETVGRDKIVTINHNYNIQTASNKDTLLGLEKIVDPSPVQPVVEKDFRITALASLQSISDSPINSSFDIKKIERFFQSVFDKSGSQRNASSLVSGAFFAIASEGTNPEWQEHSASSFRELFHEWKGGAGSISNAFNLAKGNTKDFPSMKKDSNFYSRMALYYDYFSEKCHHGHSEAVRKLRTIHKNVEIKTEDRDIFKKTVSMFLSELFEVIKTVEI